MLETRTGITGCRGRTLMSSSSSLHDRPRASADLTAFSAASTASALYSISSACAWAALRQRGYVHMASSQAARRRDQCRNLCMQRSRGPFKIRGSACASCSPAIPCSCCLRKLDHPAVCSQLAEHVRPPSLCLGPQAPLSQLHAAHLQFRVLGLSVQGVHATGLVVSHTVQALHCSPLVRLLSPGGLLSSDLQAAG